MSNVEDMNNMFNGASSFNQSLNKWDVSNVRHMDRMFEGAESFNQPLNKWNVGTTAARNTVRNIFAQFGRV